MMFHCVLRECCSPVLCFIVFRECCSSVAELQAPLEQMCGALCD